MSEKEILLPEKWSDWSIVEEIGQGSCGTVYKAKRCLKGRELFSAVKIIDIPSDEEELGVARLKYDDEQSVIEYFRERENACIKEIEVMFDLNGSPNIVKFEDFQVEEKPEIGWRIYIRMEYLEDFRLYSKYHVMTEDEVIKLASDICNALVSCEKKNVIHHNVKPGNILRSSDGNYKLSDCKISAAEDRAPGSCSTKEANFYLAPEMVKNQQYSANADIYSLGIVLYCLMNCNRFPFEDIQKEVLSDQEREEALNRRLSGETFSRPPLASYGFSEIILKACAYDPSQRYQSASEMASDLKKLNGFPEKSENSAREEKKPNGEAFMRKRRRRSTSYYIMIVFMTVGLVLAAVFGGIMGVSYQRDLKAGKTTAEEIQEEKKADMYTVTIISSDEGKMAGEESNEITEAAEETGSDNEKLDVVYVYTDGQYAVSAVSLNVRKEPDKDSESLGKLKEGEIVSSTGETADGWIQIYYSQDGNDTSAVGWVAGNYLTPVS